MLCGYSSLSIVLNIPRLQCWKLLRFRSHGIVLYLGTRAREQDRREEYSDSWDSGLGAILCCSVNRKLSMSSEGLGLIRYFRT